MASTLPAVIYTGSIQCSANNMIPDSRQILDLTTPDQNNTMLLKVMAFTRDIGRYFHTICQPDPRYFTECRVWFFRSSCINSCANPSFLWRALQCRSRCLEIVRASCMRRG